MKGEPDKKDQDTCNDICIWKDLVHFILAFYG